MASIRNSVVERPASSSSTAARLLEAARASVLSVGWRRTTLTDVARRAGVSRMTIYRTYPDMAALFGDLMTKEWADAVESVLAEPPAEGDAAALIAGRLARGVAALRDNEVFRRIVDVDPELLLPYLLDRPGRAQAALLEILADQIRQGQDAGGVRDGDPVLLARSVLLTAHGFALSGPTMADDAVPVDALDAQLADVIQRYLKP